MKVPVPHSRSNTTSTVITIQHTLHRIFILSLTMSSRILLYVLVQSLEKKKPDATKFPLLLYQTDTSLIGSSDRRGGIHNQVELT